MSQAKGTEGKEEAIVLVGDGVTGGPGGDQGDFGGLEGTHSLGMKREERVLRHG